MKYIIALIILVNIVWYDTAQDEADRQYACAVRTQQAWSQGGCE